MNRVRYGFGQSLNLDESRFSIDLFKLVFCIFVILLVVFELRNIFAFYCAISSCKFRSQFIRSVFIVYLWTNIAILIVFVEGDAFLSVLDVDKLFFCDIKYLQSNRSSKILFSICTLSKIHYFDKLFLFSHLMVFV